MKTELINLEYFLEHLEKNIRPTYCDDLESTQVEILRSHLAKFVSMRLDKDSNIAAHLTALYVIVYSSQALLERLKEKNKNFSHPVFEEFVTDGKNHVMELLNTLDGMEEIKNWLRKTFTCIIFTSSLKRRRDEAETD